MILDTWVDDAWADGSWVPESWGIGLAEEAGIGLAASVAKPVDVVIHSPHWAPTIMVPTPEKRIELRQEQTDLQEMMQIYAQWRAAA